MSQESTSVLLTANLSSPSSSFTCEKNSSFSLPFDACYSQEKLEEYLSSTEISKGLIQIYQFCILTDAVGLHTLTQINLFEKQYELC